MNDLLLHPHSRGRLEVYVSAPAHAVLLVGPAGSGKKYLSRRLAEEILGISDFSAYPYGLLVAPQEGKAIGIEPIRELERFLSLKVPARAANNRMVIINDAHLLTLEAQNALLKTLEEPPAGTLVLLTSSHKQALLPTIQSRAQAIDISRPDKADSEAYFRRQGFSGNDIAQAYTIGGGLAGLMHALLSETHHPLNQATEKARQLLGQTAYERLQSVDELAKQKTLAADVLFILQHMAHLSLLQAGNKAAARWRRILETSYAADEALKLNAQPKLALTNLMLNL